LLPRPGVDCLSELRKGSMMNQKATGPTEPLRTAILARRYTLNTLLRRLPLLPRDYRFCELRKMYVWTALRVGLRDTRHTCTIHVQSIEIVGCVMNPPTNGACKVCKYSMNCNSLLFMGERCKCLPLGMPTFLVSTEKCIIYLRSDVYV
jgi:hypothetical protein